MSGKNNNAVKTVSYIMIITLMGKILGLLRDRLLAINYGVGMEANAFFTASRIPRVFFDAVFASAISACFIPVFNEYLKKKGQKEAFDFSSNFITIVGIFTLVMTIVGMFFAAPLTNWFADGFDAETAALCTELLKILFPTIVFTGIAFSFVGILQSMDEFGIPAALSIVSNGIIIVYYLFLNDDFGVYGLTIAFLIGWAMQAIIQIPSLIKRGYRYRPIFQLNNEGMKKVFLLMLPVMVSTWVQPVNVAVNTKFASRIFQGSGVSAIEYSNTLYTIIVGVVVLSVANVIFPKLSKLNASNEKDEFCNTISQTIKALLFLVVPMMVGLMALSGPLISLIYGGKDFDTFSIMITSKALFYFSLGMIGYAIQIILSRAFFAENEGKTPLIAGAISIAVNIILCIALVERMDVGGLALASAISSNVNAIVLFIPMQRKYKGIINKKLIVDFIKMIAVACAMGAAVIIIGNYVSQIFGVSMIGKVMTVSIPSIAGICIYMLLTFALGIEESKMAFGFAGKIIRKLKR